MNDLHILHNQKIRVLLSEQDLRNPGTRQRAERISVYAVAVGQNLELSVDRLVGLRIRSSLGQIDPSKWSDLVSSEVNATEQTIIELCTQFVEMRFDESLSPQQAEEKCLKWLKNEAALLYEGGIVEAFVRVQRIIQPIGT